MIMKKIYVSPICIEYRVQTTPIMTASLDPNKDGNQNVTPDPLEPAPDEFTSRRHDVWDDEEEENY